NATPLFGEELVSVCAPKVVREDNADIRKLLSETPLLQTTTRPDAWPQWLEEHGFEKTDVSENLIGFQDFFITLQAAILGHGLALIPSFLVQRELSEGLLVDPTKLRISSDRQYYFVCSADSMESQPVTHFRNWMLSQDPLMA
ncbi:MAG: LysR substrate-binding domain-containing protein, partial [Sneathiella sp.]